jgi:biopolymer transport protein ExbD
MRLPNYQGSRGVSINLTPMIDVTFLLIIFFLVSSHMAKQENFLPIDLPLASTGTADFSDQNTLTIQIPSDGVYQVFGKQLSMAQLPGAIFEAMRQAGDKPLRIRIRTAKSVPYSNIAGLLKQCAINGNSNIVFGVYDEQGSN